MTVREILLALGLGEIHRLPLARAYRLRLRFDFKVNHSALL